jgi:hypothetical protein
MACRTMKGEKSRFESKTTADRERALLCVAYDTMARGVSSWCSMWRMWNLCPMDRGRFSFGDEDGLGRGGEYSISRR